MAEDNEQAPLAPPPLNSPFAVRELKTLFLLVGTLLAMVVISLLIEGNAAWIFDAILLGLCFSAIFRPRG
jgi:hypothetical protein